MDCWHDTPDWTRLDVLQEPTLGWGPVRALPFLDPGTPYTWPYIGDDYAFTSVDWGIQDGSANAF